MIEWLHTNWGTVAIGLAVSINVLNFVTGHWSLGPKWLKWIGFAVEVLSVVKSRGVEGLLKAPLTSKKPK